MGYLDVKHPVYVYHNILPQMATAIVLMHQMNVGIVTCYSVLSVSVSWSLRGYKIETQTIEGQIKAFLSNCSNNIWFRNSTLYVSFKTIPRPELLQQTSRPSGNHK